MKVRQDAWSHEDDLLLAETVLRHIREGSTQLIAFEEVGDKLNRTSAAVGFRWNAIVRNKYEQAIQLAKKQRKERKRAQAVIKPVHTVPQAVAQIKTGAAIDLHDVITYLTGLKNDRSHSHELRDLTEKLETANEQLKKENDRLNKELQSLEQKYSLVQEDYQSLIQIMDRARKMIVLQDNDEPGTAFKMDKNGNLEKVAK